MKPFSNQQVQRYSIRKYSLGAVSVLVGLLFFMGVNVANADEITNQTATPTKLEIVQEKSTNEQVIPTQETTKEVTNTQTSVDSVTVDTDKEVLTESVEKTTEQSNPNLEQSNQNQSIISEETEANKLVESPAKDEKIGSPATSEEKQSVSAQQVDNRKTQSYAVNYTPEAETSIVRDVTRSRATKKAKSSVLPASQKKEGYTSFYGNSSIARGDDYPVRFKNGVVWSSVDDWGQYVKECTSFVAYRLSAVNHYEIARAYGNGGEWGYRARREGVRVDNNPALGAVAWYDNQYKHVAWVSNVMGNNIEIEEYNWNGDHSYHRQVVSKDTVTGFIHFKDISRQLVKPAKGTISIQNNNKKTGTFDVVISNIYCSYGIKEVKVPVWSTANGQDDLIWHVAAKQNNGTYKLTVKANEHKNSTGEYNVHLYYVQDNGETVGVTGTTTQVQMEKPTRITGNLRIGNQKAGSFDVVISDVASPEGVKDVLVPVWSSENGQDDLIWHTATRQADGTYKLTVKSSDHKDSTGEYNVHLYYIQQNGVKVGVTGTTTQMLQKRKTINIPQSGTYTFSGRASIRAVASISSPELAYFDNGSSVYYDQIFEAEGHQWISYIGYSGNRRYVVIN